ncbi:hypothetical protein CBS101457_005030 [Exobasidium rhododendri]|nr:hypothetical protein CBS101457_005030 [Exobasidium rhododendri]
MSPCEDNMASLRGGGVASGSACSCSFQQNPAHIDTLSASASPIVNWSMASPSLLAAEGHKGSITSPTYAEELFDLPDLIYDGILARSWSPCTDDHSIGKYLERMRLPLSYRTLASRWEQLGKPHLNNLRTPLNLLVSNNSFQSAEKHRRKDLAYVAQMQESAVIETLSKFLERGEHARHDKLFVGFASHLDIFCTVDTELAAMEQGLTVKEQTALYERTAQKLLQDFESDRHICSNRRPHSCMTSAIWGEVFEWPMEETLRRFDAYRKRSSTPSRSLKPPKQGISNTSSAATNFTTLQPTLACPTTPCMPRFLFQPEQTLVQELESLTAHNDIADSNLTAPDILHRSADDNSLSVSTDSPHTPVVQNITDSVSARCSSIDNFGSIGTPLLSLSQQYDVDATGAYSSKRHRSCEKMHHRSESHSHYQDKWHPTSGLNRDIPRSASSRASLSNDMGYFQDVASRHKAERHRDTDIVLRRDVRSQELHKRDQFVHHRFMLEDAAEQMYAAAQLLKRESQYLHYTDHGRRGHSGEDFFSKRPQ